jgi:hypothetical protein
VEIYGCQITEQYYILAKEGRSIMRVGKKLHNEELHDLHFSPDIVWVMKSRMRCERHACGTK